MMHKVNYTAGITKKYFKNALINSSSVIFSKFFIAFGVGFDAVKVHELIPLCKSEKTYFEKTVLRVEKCKTPSLYEFLIETRCSIKNGLRFYGDARVG